MRHCTLIKKLIVPINFDQLSGVTSSVVEYVIYKLSIIIDLYDSLNKRKNLRLTNNNVLKYYEDF